MKEKRSNECYRRVRAILKTELNWANRIEAINTLAMPDVQYNFNVINWTLQDLRRIDAKIRKLLTYYMKHYPKADEDIWKTSKSWHPKADILEKDFKKIWRCDQFAYFGVTFFVFLNQISTKRSFI